MRRANQHDDKNSRDFKEIREIKDETASTTNEMMVSQMQLITCTTPKYPKSAYYILGFTLFDKFSGVGVRAVLALYLRNILQFPDDESVKIIHSFTTLVFLFPILGAVLADSYIGKYRTMVYMSIIQLLGIIAIAVAATSLFLPPRIVCLFALLLIAIGTGAAKPCKIPFSGDQFELPQQKKELDSFFSIFYFVVNIGALTAIFASPILRQSFQCFGQTTCYPLPFGVSAIFMALSLIILMAGKSTYISRKLESNIIVNSTKCIVYALKKKLASGKESERPSHWLEYAQGKFDKQLIMDTREALSVTIMHLPAPMYWALSEQQHSSWTFQACQMDGSVFNWFTIRPDQLRCLNPLLCLLFIPLYEIAVYPVLAKMGLKRPLQFMILGFSLVAAAFVVSAFVEYKLEPSYPVHPEPGKGQLRIFNGYPCRIEIDPPIEGHHEIPPLGALQVTGIKMKRNFTIMENFSITSGKLGQENCCLNLGGLSNWSQPIGIYDHRSVSYVAFMEKNRTSLLRIPGFDDVSKSLTNRPKLRVIHNLQGVLTLIDDSDNTQTIHLAGNNVVTPLNEIDSGMVRYVPKVETREPSRTDTTYFRRVWKDRTENAPATLQAFETDSILVSRKTEDSLGFKVMYQNEPVLTDLKIKNGGVYSLVLQKIGDKVVGSLHTITNPATLHILWLVPQIAIGAAAEIFFSVNDMQFTFTEAPASMKALMSAVSCLSVALGNTIIVIISEIQFFKRQSYQFLMYAGLMGLDTIALIILAIRYTYKRYEQDNDSL